MTSVQRDITVDTTPERAFAVFTERFDSWWPRGHRIGTGELEEVVIEPRLGGRWFERSSDGSECVWGEVLAWEPPHRLMLSWHLDGEWKLGPEGSEIEVRFTPVGSSTRVELEHRHFERHGATGDALREAVAGEGGWETLLELYRGAVGSNSSAAELMQ
jgi:uncharacterized protein YndB with AHSA1/START domain